MEAKSGSLVVAPVTMTDVRMEGVRRKGFEKAAHRSAILAVSLPYRRRIEVMEQIGDVFFCVNQNVWWCSKGGVARKICAIFQKCELVLLIVAVGKQIGNGNPPEKVFTTRQFRPISRVFE